ncbi:O-antigen ligase family protein [Akkermansiaceae bacterium]|nr:O-antigen ligase family protein [Akkermansiaceae bacterium]
MSAFSSILWTIGLILTVTLGPQLRIWSWGPAMLCFSGAALFAIPALWREKGGAGDTVIAALGAALVSWMAARAFLTPVPEAAQADILLLAMAVATFVSFRAAASSTAALRIIIAGIALLTCASLLVMARQLGDPGFSPFFSKITSRYPTGFYAHYSYGGSFLIAVSLLLGGLAMHSRENRIVRLLLGIIALLAFCAIYFTRSRGAILGGAGGFGALMLLTLVIGKRDGRKWFAPAVIAVPLIAGGIIFALVAVWMDAQEARNESGGFAGLLDNTIRWHLIGIAISCIQLHPLWGGGARSYSWECFRFWDIGQMGIGSNKPEHVHNELLQTASDYGIIGASLLVVFLCAIVIACMARTAMDRRSAASPHADGWRIGGFAGLVGLFLQSNFEGIFRIAPGAVLLALCISAACFGKTANPNPSGLRPWLRASLVSVLGLGAIISLALAGTRGTRVSIILWPSHFGPEKPGHETAIDALARAIEIWPLQSLYQKRGLTCQRAAAAETSAEISRSFIKQALADFQASSELHPYDPAAAVGYANLLSNLGRHAEAEAAYTRAIQLQGGMEAAFKSYLSSAKHFHGKALSEYDPGRPADSLADFQIAARHIDKAFADSWMHGTENRVLRVLIHQNYGQTLEAAGEPKAALAQYDLAAKLPYGGSSHYHAGLLLGRMAVRKWSDRRAEDAMFLFTQASQRIGTAGDNLPDGVTPSKRAEYMEYLLNTIQYLKGAGIKPSESVDLDPGK